MTETTYLDVSVVRVQPYLARTAQLRLRRGASTMIVEATENQRWAEPQSRGLAPGWTLNPEAGDLSGVVALQWTGTEPPDVNVAARVVAHALRDALPQAHLRAVERQGPSYAQAYSAPDRVILDSPPPAPEIVLAARCDWCNSAPALANPVRDERSGRDRHVCDDCRRRKKAAGSTTGHDSRQPATEARLLSCLTDITGETRWRCPDDFAELAASTDSPGNHVATVFADGNRVGAFLDEAATQNVRKDQIVSAIDEASSRAVARAAMHTLPRKDGLVPCTVHVLGGDDILVSVPADSGWSFTADLPARFSDELQRQTEGNDGAWGEVSTMPTISVGLVFHHHSAPFADVVHLAEQQLKAAKRAVEGREASVAFLDLTADGMAVPHDRPASTLTELQDLSADLRSIAALPQSARQVYLQRCDEGTDHVRQQVTDNDRTVPGHRAIADRIAGLDADDVPGRVRTLVDMARWWPPRASRTADLQ